MWDEELTLSSFPTMSSRPLQNYLRMYRKRSGFSQEDISFLLNAMCGAKTCRYERNHRLPPLKTAFGLEVIFGVPTRELFPGVYRKAAEGVASRAKGLIGSVMRRKETRVTAPKVEALQRILSAVNNDEEK